MHVINDTYYILLFFTGSFSDPFKKPNGIYMLGDKSNEIWLII